MSKFKYVDCMHDNNISGTMNLPEANSDDIKRLFEKCVCVFTKYVCIERKSDKILKIRIGIYKN